MSATTVYEEAGYPHGIRKVQEFVDAFGVIRALTPFGPWGDVFDQFRQVREYVEGQHRLSSSFSTSNLCTETDLVNRDAHRRIKANLNALGSWEVDEGGPSSTRFANPGYKHDQTLDHLDGPEERVPFAERAAGYGMLRVAGVARAFGTNSKAASEFLHRYDVHYRKARAEGAARLVRSVILGAEWLDRTQRSLVRDLGITPSTFDTWRSRYDCSFPDGEIPPDPYDVYDQFPG